jgi:hypothetical protein
LRRSCMPCPEKDCLVMNFCNDSVANPYAKILATP